MTLRFSNNVIIIRVLPKKFPCEKIVIFIVIVLRGSVVV